MKPWKAALGVGAACAACCAVPLIGGVAAVTTGSVAVAAMGSTLLACADELLPLAIVLSLLAALVLGVIFWRRRKHAQAAAHCVVGPEKACGCPPGKCA